MRFVLLLSGLVALLVAACGGDSGLAAPAATATPAPAAAPAPAVSSRAAGCSATSPTGSTVRSITSDGVPRTYRVFVPPSYSPAEPTAVVLNYHGFAGIASDQEAYTGMPDAATRYGFIAVAPDGSGEPQRWNLVATGRQGFADDYAFTRRMLDDLASAYCVDPARVYASGISNGGFFSSVAACEMQDRIAAVATVAGEGFPDDVCGGKKPVPVLVFHGTADATVPFEPRAGTNRAGIRARSTRESVTAWARFNGCDAAGNEQRVAPDVLFVSYDGCRDRADTQLYIVEGGGHSWPGAPAVEILGHTTQSINATDLMWRFFAAHPKG